MSISVNSLVNFMFSVGSLSNVPRSGFAHLGSGKQSVAEHTVRTVFIGYLLGSLDPSVDMEKLLKLCLFHDISEARTGDLNYVQQKYDTADEAQAIQDMVAGLPFSVDVIALTEEFKARNTKEAILAKDADNLELILSLKEQIDTGNPRGKSWFPLVVKRLRTPAAKKIARQIAKSHVDDWWFGDRNDSWWVTRNKKGSRR